MKFRISHETSYRYSAPASESVGELRVCPQTLQDQIVTNRQLHLDPDVPVDSFTDYFGNTVECFSIPFRHKSLRVRMAAEVETFPPADPGKAGDMPVGQVRRLGADRHVDLYLYRLPTATIPLGNILSPLRKTFFRDAIPLRKALTDLNRWIFEHFEYQSGVSDVSTPLKTIIRERKGVCQDFAHLMLSILRTHGIAARYVSGYIEPVDPTATGDTELIGAAASHAWVEVSLPDGGWWGFDPTNNQVAGERHVKIAVGRDYHDVAPRRGTFKGAVNHKLQVIVSMKRKGASRTTP